jgi:dTMP kinase
MFITFEGIDFCGKSTQVKLLEKYLVGQGKKIKIIREPGGTAISEEIREILLDKKNNSMYSETEILLFSASRAQLVREVIIPCMREDYYVISDRFHDSLSAYQGYGRGMDLDFVKTINSFAIGQAVPDITFFLDIPVDEADKRKKLNSHIELDRIETSQNGFYENVRRGYLKIAETEKRFKIIDGMNMIDYIHEKIISELKIYESKKK